MIIEQFFTGRLSGFGVVTGLSGKVLRRFDVQLNGEWSEEHRALHLDETYTYLGGETLTRNWAIHTDEEGFVLGIDANQAARLRGRARGMDFRLIFDRPKRPGGPLELSQVVDFFDVGQGQAVMKGRVTLFGLTLATTQSFVKRVD